MLFSIGGVEEGRWFRKHLFTFA